MRTKLALLAILTATSSSHAQWTLETSNTTADLRGIDNVGGGVAWASGTSGTVLRTEDGGYVWQSCSIPPGAEKLDFRGIQAFDANTAIVMSSGTGDLSRLYKTTDGCHSWKLLFTNPDKDGFWDALYFDRGKWGWLLGDPVKNDFGLFSSDDQGLTWTKKRNEGLNADSAAQGAFAASNSSLIAPIENVVFATGGTGGAFLFRRTQTQICVDDCSREELDTEGRKDKWERQQVPLGSHTKASGIFSVGSKNGFATNPPLNLTIVVVGGDYSKPDDSSATAAWSLDWGEHWTAAQTPPHGYRSAVAYNPAAKTWITVGPNGTDISTDDGKNWRALHPDPAQHEPPDADRNWNALSLPFVVGPHGRIGKLDEGTLKH